MGIQNGAKLYELKAKMNNGVYSKPKPGEEIVITGMSGKFPDSNDINHFRDNLFNKVDLVSGDYRRWKPIHPEVPQRTGKMFDIDKFDPGFFGIPLNHCNNMDPMCRMVLERVYEALLDAGHHPFDLQGTDTGVYIGCCFSETEKSTFYNNLTNCDSITGCQRSMLAKRISYYFKLNGVGFIADTACSSTLFALEHAYRHLKEGRNQKAIIAGTQLCLHPIVSLQFARLGVLSPDGSCKSFDDSGNGYARSEAVTVIILEKLKDSKRFYAEVIHSKTNCDGYKEQGITFPSSNMQKVLMKEFYEECKINPSDLTFVEAHGTGTKVGDPEELETLDEIFCKNRDEPLHIGTVKSSIGHNEPVSGLCSIVKVLIGFESGFIPPNINYKTPRKGVEALEKGRLVVVTEKIPWPDNKGLVGINSFGFGGGNAHLLLRWNPKVKINFGKPRDNLPRLICVSGRSKEMIFEIFDECAKMDGEFIKLIHQVFRKNIPNSLFNGYLIVSKECEIERMIFSNVSNVSNFNSSNFSNFSKNFSNFSKNFSNFSKNFSNFSKNSSNFSNNNLNSLPKNKLRIIFNNTNNEWHHQGKNLLEIPTFSSSIQKIHEILQKNLEINISEILIDENIKNPKNPKNLKNTTEIILGFVTVQLALADLIKTLNLNYDEIIGIGFGELSAAYLDGFLTLEEAILAAYYISKSHKKGGEFFCSNKDLNGKKWVAIYDKECSNFYPQGSLDYFIQNISKPVDFEERINVYSDGSMINLIIGGSFENRSDSDLVLIGNTTFNPIHQLLQSLGRLYLLGFPSQLDNIYPKISFPVSRGTAMLSPLIKWNHSESYTVHLYKNEEERKSGQRVMHISARLEDWNFVTGHVVDGRNLFPATGYLALVWESYAIIMGKLMSDTSVIFEDVKFLRAANVPKEETLSLRVIIQLENKLFEIVENDNLLASGRVYALNQEQQITNTFINLGNLEETEMNENDIYKELKLRGYHYTNQFRAIKKYNWNDNKALISWNGNWITFMDNMLQIQILNEDTRSLCIPTSIKRVVIDGPKHIKDTVNYNNLIPVVFNKDLQAIISGGIEIIGLGASVIPRRKPAEAVLEKYQFIPYEMKLKRENAIRCFVQTILENSNTIKVKAIEVLNDKSEYTGAHKRNREDNQKGEYTGAHKRNNEDVILPLVQQSLGDLPLIQAELKILSKRDDLDVSGILVEDKSIQTESGCLILIVEDVFENPEFLLTALRVTRDVSGFIIAKERKNFTPNDKNFIPNFIQNKNLIQILSLYETEKENLYLIKESSQYIERIPVNINNDVLNDFSWMEKLKNLSSKKLLLYSQKADGLLGFVNCLRREPNFGSTSAVIIMGDAPPFDMEDDFYKKQVEKNLAINVFKDGKWGSYRHLLLSEIGNVEKEHCYVNVMMRGDLSSLKWIEGPLSSESVQEPDTELVNIHYSSLNFRDIMTATGKLSPDAITRDRILQECIQGLEFSGCLTKDPTKRVMGMCVSGALSTMMMADVKLLWPFPDNWTYEDAVTVPVVYGTVLYAFIMRGRMKPNQSVLIHSGTGGVGQAAINIATHMGCTIFTTVGTQEKRDFIKRNFPQIKEEHIGDSRSTSFEQMIFQQTNGKGVDFVLNSLAEEKLQASVRCLARNGTFLEIGKFDLANDNELAAALLKKQATFQGIMLDQVFSGGIEKTKETLSRLIRDGILNGSIKPLVRTVFTSDKIEEAFRFMATGKHIGKVVIKVRDENDVKKYPQLFKGIPRLSCNHTVCYVILGGLGGFGLELADWLVTRGVKHLVLSSRSGLKNGYQKFRLNIFKSYGVETHIRNDDITTENGCRTLLKFAGSLAPVEGIFNLAVVLKDALFENQTVDSFKISLQPKALATCHLDKISREICPDLKYFVVFSSVSCGRGNAGQTNYGMANSIMERICEQRKKDGFPALAIQWGAVGEVGLVADMQENHKELVIGGTLQQRISNCLQVLDRLLKQDEAIVASMVVAEKRSGVGASNIFDAVLNVIGVTNLKAVSHHATFPELGMDSMMAIEIKQTLEREYEVFLTAQDIRNMTISKLKDLVSDQSDVVSKPDKNEFETDLPEDIKLLFRHIGDEQTSNEPIIHLKSFKNLPKDNKPLIAFAGIEGMAGIYETISKRLHSNLTCLQFCAENHSDSIEEIAEPLANIILNTTTGDFNLIAYSFGCVVATEIMYILEANGRIGKALFIDGAPELMTRLTKMYFPFYDDEIFQTTLLSVLMTRYMPFDTIIKHKQDIIKKKTYEEKIKYIMSVSPAINHSEKYIVEMCKAGLSRLKAVRKYEPRMEKLKSTICLVKPSKQTLVEIADDYNLSTVTNQPVKVKILDGNHVSILENKQLVEEIEEFFKVEKQINKIPLRNVGMEISMEVKTI